MRKVLEEEEIEILVSVRLIGPPSSFFSSSHSESKSETLELSELLNYLPLRSSNEFRPLFDSKEVYYSSVAHLGVFGECHLRRGLVLPSLNLFAAIFRGFGECLGSIFCHQWKQNFASLHLRDGLNDR